VNVFEPNPVYIHRMSGSAMSCHVQKRSGCTLLFSSPATQTHKNAKLRSHVFVSGEQVEENAN